MKKEIKGQTTLPKPPSKAALQMTVMDLEFEGPLSSFAELCDKLAEKHKTTAEVIRKIVMAENVITKTPKASAVRDWEMDDEEPEPQIEPEVLDPEPQPESAKPEPVVENSKPVYHYSEPKIAPTKVDEKPLEKCQYSDRYKVEWLKWYEVGVADRVAGRKENYDQLPKLLPVAENLPNFSGEDPARVWASAYWQGYNNWQGKRRFVYLGQHIPTAAAAGLTFQEWRDKCLSDSELWEMF